MKKRIIILVMVLFVAIISTKAQAIFSTTGGELDGSSGIASYTLGQVVYTTEVGTGGLSILQGVQQPYEISIVNSIKDAKEINLCISAYPNPTINYLTVKVENYSTDHLLYQLFDINGKLLQSIKASGTNTVIKMNYLLSGNYFVKVLDNHEEIKVFKIIKH